MEERAMTTHTTPRERVEALCSEWAARAKDLRTRSGRLHRDKASALESCAAQVAAALRDPVIEEYERYEASREQTLLRAIARYVLTLDADGQPQRATHVQIGNWLRALSHDPARVRELVDAYMVEQT
jgi:hypothetical protein